MNDSKTGSQIIGGMFGLGEAFTFKDSRPPFLNERCIFLVNARSGISLIAELLSPPQIWMPSYLCDVMVEAVAGMVPRFYGVNYDLVIPSLAWLNDVQKGDLVLLIDYFGFPLDPSLIALVKERGAWVLEDACQALLSTEVGRYSDFVLFSPRKFLGVPDGGVLITNCEIDLDGVDLQSPPASWWLKAFRAAVLRREFDLYGGNRRWFQLFRETDANGPIGPYAMSELSRMLLRHSFDYSTIAQRRIDNYHVLSDRLGDLALLPKLSSGVVPLGFPVRLENRDQVRQVLFDHEIYPPVHWAIQGVVPAEFQDSHRLSTDIMTLPCDQRYSASDMERMANLVLSMVASTTREIQDSRRLLK